MRSFLVVFAVVASVGCGQEGQEINRTVPPGPVLRVASIWPSTIYAEGTEEVRLKVENTCGNDAFSITVGGTPVALIPHDELGPDQYAFAPPARAVAPGTTDTIEVRLTCAAPRPGARPYAIGGHTTTTALVYSGDSEPDTLLAVASPVGAIDGTLVQVGVRFNRAVDDHSVTSETFGIVGVAGQVSSGPDLDYPVFTFRPDAPLQPGTTYTAFVTTGIRSANAHRPLVTTPPAEGTTAREGRIEWEFTTAGQ